MRVVVAGGTGFIGAALADRLRARGDDVLVLTRQTTRAPDRVTWDPTRGITQLRRLEGVDAVVNLAGEPLATRPWTRGRKEVLVRSRVDATVTLLRELQRLETPPTTYVGVASLGLFGSRGDDWLDDDDHPGEGFLADLAARWELAHLTAWEVVGARAAVLRPGMVLGPTGGALPPLLGVFRRGLGGWIGDGTPWTPWISRDDTVRALLHLLDTPSLRGGFNGTVPVPMRFKAFAEALGHAVRQPVTHHAPGWALRGALGDLASELLLASCRARPRKLLESGFVFEDADAEAYFRRVVDTPF